LRRCPLVSTPLLVGLILGLCSLSRQSAAIDRPPLRSLVTLLALDDYQLVWLDRIHDDFARIRAEEQDSIDMRREELRIAEARTPPDDGRIRRLVREISASGDRIADAYLRARSQSYRVLNRRQERELAALRDAGTPFRRDRYRDMLVRSVEDVWDAPFVASRPIPEPVATEPHPGTPVEDDPDFVVVKPRRPEKRVEPSREIPEESKGPYTSLIVDCRDFGVERSMSPRIRVPDGREVWGTVDVNYDWVIEHGIVVYARTMRDALRSDRAGSNPLVVQAVGRAGGNFHSDAVVSERDADRILDANKHDKILDRFRVIFILDPDQ